MSIEIRIPYKAETALRPRNRAGTLLRAVTDTIANMNDTVSDVEEDFVYYLKAERSGEDIIITRPPSWFIHGPIIVEALREYLAGMLLYENSGLEARGLTIRPSEGIGELLELLEERVL